MRIFISEYITVGEMNDKTLPPNILADAEIMIRALLRDASEIKGVEIISTRDSRLDKLHDESLDVNENDDILEVWGNLMESCDIACIIAPETDGILIKMTELLESTGCVNAGCDLDSVKLTSSKIKTTKLLTRNNISCVDSNWANETCPESDCGWVVKPDDGAASSDCYFFDCIENLDHWLKQNTDNTKYIIQKFIQGEALSLSAIFKAGRAELLSCNKQMIEFKNGRVFSNGVIVNKYRDKNSTYQKIIDGLAAIIPGLNGYAGIDLILADSGPVVLEINPRITSSYAGLRKALNINIAEYILENCLGLPASRPLMHLNKSDTEQEIICHGQ